MLAAALAAAAFVTGRSQAQAPGSTPQTLWTIISPDGRRPMATTPVNGREMVSAEELIAWSREHLASFKCPRTIIFAEVPKTSTGKSQKFRLRDLARAQRPEPS